jgi:hypothetical protein
VSRLGTITVEAGNYTRNDTPVSLDLSGVPEVFPGDDIRLVEVKGSRRLSVSVQFEAGSPPRLWWVLSGTTEPGIERKYELLKGDASATRSISAMQDKKVLELQKDGMKVLSYNHAVVPPPAGQSELYNRSAFIHPAVVAIRFDTDEYPSGRPLSSLRHLDAVDQDEVRGQGGGFLEPQGGARDGSFQ